MICFHVAWWGESSLWLAGERLTRVVLKTRRTSLWVKQIFSCILDWNIPWRKFALKSTRTPREWVVQNQTSKECVDMMCEFLVVFRAELSWLFAISLLTFWFSRQDVGASSNVLLHADIPVTADCNEAIKGVEVNEKKQICAGKRGYDSCNGDSGGPLVMG